MKEAQYTYYAHGPLARTELGNDQVQGLDYVYTLQGWMKAVNSNTLDVTRDPGLDAGSGTNQYVASDVYGFSLHYFIARHVYDDSWALEKSTYYALDAQGNDMSVYEYVVDNSTSTVTYTGRKIHLRLFKAWSSERKHLPFRLRNPH